MNESSEPIQRPAPDVEPMRGWFRCLPCLLWHCVFYMWAQSSEARFIRSLRTLVSVYAEPMARALLDDSQAAAIFRNVLALKDMHTQIRGLLNDAGDSDSVTEAIGKLSRGFGR